ncbi:MAG TPA: hypothetical protein VL461_15055 [Dictyobacter sp.]|jgi:hypothetical protein|nr:hypothetical protein [Dictyobacter sp.]
MPTGNLYKESPGQTTHLYPPAQGNAYQQMYPGATKNIPNTTPRPTQQQRRTSTTPPMPKDRARSIIRTCKHWGITAAIACFTFFGGLILGHTQFSGTAAAQNQNSAPSSSTTQQQPSTTSPNDPSNGGFFQQQQGGDGGYNFGQNNNTIQPPATGSGVS